MEDVLREADADEWNVEEEEGEEEEVVVVLVIVVEEEANTELNILSAASDILSDFSVTNIEQVVSVPSTQPGEEVGQDVVDAMEKDVRSR